MLNEDHECLAEVEDADERRDVRKVMHQIMEFIWDTPQLRQDSKVRKRVLDTLDDRGVRRRGGGVGALPAG
jgi:hypothetical protein